MASARRLVVAALAYADLAVDDVLYRPAVVKAFVWLPRWWLCDLARLPIKIALTGDVRDGSRIGRDRSMLLGRRSRKTTIRLMAEDSAPALWTPRGPVEPEELGLSLELCRRIREWAREVI